MDKVFLTILNMSLISSFVIAVVLAARLFLRRAPKIYSYVLWAVVLFNLLCPFKFKSVFSLMPFGATPISEDTLVKAPAMYMGAPVAGKLNPPGNAGNNSIPANPPVVTANTSSINDTPGSSAFSKENWLIYINWLWLAGIAGMLFYAAVSLALLKRKLRFATKLGKETYETDLIRSPFVLGIVSPKIYLPVGMAMNDLAYILLHEQTHIKRRDYLIKPLSYLALAIHWFNPLVWLAYFLLGKDMEMSCDEYVLKKMGHGNGNIKEIYSTALLRFATGKRLIGLSPLAFGEGSAKERIMNVLNFRKPSRWVVAIAAILVIILTVGCSVFKSEDLTTQNGSVENIAVLKDGTTPPSTTAADAPVVAEEYVNNFEEYYWSAATINEAHFDHSFLVTNSTYKNGKAVFKNTGKYEAKIYIYDSNNARVGYNKALPDSSADVTFNVVAMGAYQIIISNDGKENVQGVLSVKTYAPAPAPVPVVTAEPVSVSKEVGSKAASQLAYEQRIPNFFASGNDPSFLSEAYANNFFVNLDKPIVSNSSGLALALNRYILTGECTVFRFQVNGLPEGKVSTKFDTEAGTYTSDRYNPPVQASLKLKDENGKTIFDSDRDYSLGSMLYETQDGVFLELSLGEKNNSNWGDHAIEIPNILEIEINQIAYIAGDTIDGQWEFTLPVDDMFKNITPLYYKVTNSDYCDANGIYVDNFYSTATATRMHLTVDSSKNSIQQPTGDNGFAYFENPNTHGYADQKLFVLVNGQQLFGTAADGTVIGYETEYYWRQKTDKGTEYFIYMPPLYFSKPENVTVRVLDENRNPLDIQLQLENQ